MNRSLDLPGRHDPRRRLKRLENLAYFARKDARVHTVLLRQLYCEASDPALIELAMADLIHLRYRHTVLIRHRRLARAELAEHELRPCAASE